MTAERQDILTDFYAGNSKIIRVLVVKPDGSPKDISNAEITYAMVTDTGIIILSKSSTAGSSEIEIVSGIGGAFVVKINPPDTITLAGTYRHHANVVDTNGDDETVMVGKVNISKSFARRYRRNTKTAYLLGTT
jgi:hypothetical protein